MAGFRSAAFWVGRSIGGDAPPPQEILGGHFLEKEKPKRKTKTVRESIEEVLSPPTEVIAEQVREALQPPQFDVPDLSDVEVRLDRAESILQEQEAIDRRKKRALRLLILDV